MKFLFVYAHPDDETVAAGGTIAMLRQAGHDVRVVLMTDGAAGETSEQTKQAAAKAGSLAALRVQETKQALLALGVEDFYIHEFDDGSFCNQDIWLTHEKNGFLTDVILDEINEYQPDVVVTFDSTGWYFHLDHIAVSLSAMRALQQATKPVDIFMLNPFQPPGIKDKWKYVYPENISVTHTVDVFQTKAAKIKALYSHKSQNLEKLVEHIESGELGEELFQVVDMSEKGEKLLKDLEMFESV